MSHPLHRVLVVALLAAALLAQEPGAPTFNSTAKIVLVPFNVQRGKYFAADLQRSDFALREDGHPRGFTVFEGPNTDHPLPLEFILLFDTTRVPAGTGGIASLWNPESDYDFLRNWDESLTGAILQKNGMDIRIAVYHYAGRQLERLCAATSNPREIVQAFHGLLDPIPAGKGELTLLSGSHIEKPLFDKPFQGWLSESIVSTMKDAAASPVAARRVLIVFTTGMSGTGSNSPTSLYSSLVDPALALSMPIEPVIMDHYEQNVVGTRAGPGGATSTVDTPKSLADTLSSKPGGAPATVFAGLLPWITKVGELTGGEAFVPQRLDREALGGILGSLRDTVLSQYVVGFVPVAAPKPKKHSLAVALTSKSTGKIIGGEKNGVTY